MNCPLAITSTWFGLLPSKTPSSPCLVLWPRVILSIRQPLETTDIVQLPLSPSRRRLLASPASWGKSMRAMTCSGRSTMVACWHSPAGVKAFLLLVRLIFVPFDAFLMMSFIDTSTTRVQNSKRNMKAFGSCENAPPAAICFDKQFPPFINFDEESMWTLFILIFFGLSDFFPISVPIYDARSHPFEFSKKDFVGLPSLPRYKKHGDPKLADLPPNALVTVFFSLNTYTSSRAPPTPSTHKMMSWSDNRPPVASSSAHSDDNSARGSNSHIGTSQVLSTNLQFCCITAQFRRMIRSRTFLVLLKIWIMLNCVILCLYLAKYIFWVLCVIIPLVLGCPVSQLLTISTLHNIAA